jgi:hypothetical protein
VRNGKNVLRKGILTNKNACRQRAVPGKDADGEVVPSPSNLNLCSIYKLFMTCGGGVRNTNFSTIYVQKLRSGQPAIIRLRNKIRMH